MVCPEEEEEKEATYHLVVFSIGVVIVGGGWEEGSIKQGEGDFMGKVRERKKRGEGGEDEPKVLTIGAGLFPYM